MIPPVAKILILGLVLVSLDCDTAHAQVQRTDLFHAGDAGYALYRIPGLVVTKQGSILAYCEARKSDRGDWGKIDLMLRRSDDGGQTWSPQTLIGKVDGPIKPNPVSLAQGLAVGSDDITYNNPVAIADHRSGDVHFLFCIEYMRVFYMRSTDDGVTFSVPVEITNVVEPLRQQYDWKVVATGPGHGIQLTSGPHRGRLVVPVWISTGTGGHAHRPSVTTTIYSDDSGSTWHSGEIALPDVLPLRNPNETVVVQLADGQVMLNARTESDAHRRVVTTSPDGATQWSEARFDPQLVEPICMGSIIRLSRQPQDDRNRLLFCNPNSLEPRPGQTAEPGRPRLRQNVTVRLSYDEGNSWPVAKSIDPGISGYSDLAVDAQRVIHCLYERGGKGQDAYKTSFLTLASFDLNWLTDGADRDESSFSEEPPSSEP